MYWFIYFITSVFLSVILTLKLKKYTFEVLILLLIILMTPTQVELQGYAPSLFTFFFSVVFEQNFSLRPLRPLVITLPLSILLLTFYLTIKRKFF